MSRKYRHRGYQDRDSWDDRERDWDRRHGRDRTGGFLDDQPSRSSRDPRERTGRKQSEPEYRDKVFKCHLCGQPFPNPESLQQDDQCPNCSAAMWCCRTCRFFDPQARLECRQEIEKRIKRKDAPNKCDLFEPRLVIDISGRSKSKTGGLFDTETDEASRKAFEALFGDDS